jgi:hypothetical protein
MIRMDNLFQYKRDREHVEHMHIRKGSCKGGRIGQTIIPGYTGHVNDLEDMSCMADYPPHFHI